MADIIKEGLPRNDNVLMRKYYKKRFVGSSTKEAYLNACKWVASNVIRIDELARNTSIKYIKEEADEQLPTITVILYAIVNEDEIRERHCKLCKETHSLFFINENCNCSWCNTSAYGRRCDDFLKKKVDFCYGLLFR